MFIQTPQVYNSTSLYLSTMTTMLRPPLLNMLAESVISMYATYKSYAAKLQYFCSNKKTALLLVGTQIMRF